MTEHTHIWPYFHHAGNNYFVGQCACAQCESMITDDVVHTIVENRGNRPFHHLYCRLCISQAAPMHRNVAMLMCALVVEEAPEHAVPMPITLPELAPTSRDLDRITAPVAYHPAHKQRRAYTSLKGAKIGRDMLADMTTKERKTVADKATANIIEELQSRLGMPLQLHYG